MSNDGRPDLSTLFPRVAAGDQEARRQVFERLYERLCELAGRPRPPGGPDPGSLADRVVIKLLARDDLPTSSEDEFLAYCAKTIRHTLIDLLRADWQPIDHDYPSLSSVVAASATGPASQAERSELFAELLRLVDELPEEHQHIVDLHVIHELSAARVARFLGMPATEASRKKVQRLWADIRRQLAKKLTAKFGPSPGMPT